MIKTTSLIFLSVLALQNWSYDHNEEFDFFMSDNMGHNYIVDEEKLVMINSDGEKMFEYSDMNYGEISSFDQTSALRSLVYYEEQSVFVILDNTLAIQSPAVRLNQFNFNYIKLMCVSENNHYWCYSSEKNSIIRINQQLNIVSTGEDLNQLIGAVVNPVQITERNGKVFLNDPDNGIHVFDTYGNFDRTLEIINAEKIAVRNNNLYFLNDNVISGLNLIDFTEVEILSSKEKISDFSFVKNNLRYAVGTKLFEKKNVIFLS